MFSFWAAGPGPVVWPADSQVVVDREAWPSYIPRRSIRAALGPDRGLSHDPRGTDPTCGGLK